MTSGRFPYEPYQLPYLEVSLAHAQHTITSHALVDSGSCVNGLPLRFEQAMDLQWDMQQHPILGQIRGEEALGVKLSVRIHTFPPVELSFAWVHTDTLPLILGQVDFFQTFQVNFDGAAKVFDLILSL